MGQPPVHVLAGWVAPALSWADFVDDWRNALLASPRIRRFKFDDAMGNTSDFFGLSDDSRKLKLQMLVHVIEKHKLTGIASIVPHDLFQKYFGRHSSHDISNPYIPSFYGIVSRLVRHYIRDPGVDKIEFVFDYQPDRGRDVMKRVQDGWDLFYRNSPPEFKALINLHPPSFLSDSEFTALEAADLHAGWVRMLNTGHLAGDDPEPPWGQVGSQLLRLNWIMTEEFARTCYEQMFGAPISYTFRYGLDSSNR